MLRQRPGVNRARWQPCSTARTHGHPANLIAEQSRPCGGSYDLVWEDALQGAGRQRTAEDIVRLLDVITKQLGIDKYKP